jgi:hypothetical protein
MIRPYLWFCRVLFCCTRTAGAVGTRLSLRPLIIRRRNRFAKLGRIVPRDRGGVSFQLFEIRIGNGAHSLSTSSWRRPGPIRRGAHVERRWSTAFVQQRPRPGVMGPGLRQDDIVCVASECVQGWAKGASRAVPTIHRQSHPERWARFHLRSSSFLLRSSSFGGQVELRRTLLPTLYAGRSGAQENGTAHSCHR